MDFRLKVPDSCPSLLLAWYLNWFPIYALALQCDTLHPEKVLPGIEGQKAAETGKPDS